jgi:hypothetical protein
MGSAFQKGDLYNLYKGADVSRYAHSELGLVDNAPMVAKKIILTGGSLKPDRQNQISGIQS